MADVVNGLHAGNPINDPKQSAPNRTTGFPLNYKFGQTLRFGELTPNFVMNCIPDDKIKININSDLTSYTFKAPLMQSLSHKKDYYSVPMEAILPLQWSRIYANPNMGDDVPEDAYTNVNVNEVIASTLYEKWVDYNTSQTISNKNKILRALEVAFALESVYSDGSLLANLGCHLSRCIDFEDGDSSDIRTIDELIDTIASVLVRFKVVIQIDNGQPSEKEFRCEDALGVRLLFEYIRDNGGFPTATQLYSSNDSEVRNIISDAIGILGIYSLDSDNRTIDLSRLYAYQIVCAHYYSNDRVDYIYSAELYRQNLSSFMDDNDKVQFSSVFEYNGINLPYDYLSAHYFNAIVQNNDITTIAKYLSLIFGFRHSLRYVDYFTGAKTRPLAIGDTRVDVNSSKVDVVDVTRNIQLQRFLNAVNRSGRKISDYVKGLFGVNQAHDFHDPMYLYHTSDVIYGDRTSNTGDNQFTQPNSVTQVMNSNSGNQFFEFTCDRPCIVIGIQYIDVDRLYSETIERFFFHKDRFDMFNPFMEFIGDQSIFANELSPALRSGTFGFTTRYMEYKQKYGYVAGGFKKNLPGYTFIAEKTAPNFYNQSDQRINPAFIRSSNIELDDFYVSLTGYSLSSYFHFIEMNNINITAVRPMSYSPNIL